MVTFIISLKKNIPIEYKIKAPTDIEITETIVPIQWPNNTPEIIKMGDPKPRSVTQIIENTKK